MAYLGMAVLGIAVLETAVLGVAVVGILVLGVAVDGVAVEGVAVGVNPHTSTSQSVSTPNPVSCTLTEFPILFPQLMVLTEVATPIVPHN